MKRRMTTKNRYTYIAGLLLLLPAIGLVAQGTKKKAEPYAIVAGTVFRDPGFAQPGASVVLVLKSAPAKKLQEQISSPRGEFAFRVPPGPNVYFVTATLKGFQTARQEIEIQEQEQINATLLLVPESKEKKR
jgi:hypothetical protein